MYPVVLTQLLQYWKAVENACLIPDLQVLADGDLTEVRRICFTFWDLEFDTRVDRREGHQ